MTTREKILLVFMGLSLIGGAPILLDISGRSDRTQPKGYNALLQKASEAVHEAASSIGNLNLKMEQKYVLAAARRPVSRNPFARPPEPSTSGNKPRQSRSSTPVSPAYTGYIAAGTQVLAIIGGLEYHEGDRLPGTDDLILHIRPDKVILYAPTRDREWELPYTGDDL